MNDLTHETKLTLREAAALPVFLRLGKPISTMSLRRYASRGARARDGSVVVLEVWYMPSGYVTTTQAVQRFIARLNGQSTTTLSTVPPDVRRNRTSDACAALGI